MSAISWRPVLMLEETGDIIIVKCRHIFGVLESVNTNREVRDEHIIFMQPY